MSGLTDKIEGLEADLRMAVAVAYNRGATEWAKLNYPQWMDWLESQRVDPAIAPGITITLGYSKVYNGLHLQKWENHGLSEGTCRLVVVETENKM